MVDEIFDGYSKEKEPAKYYKSYAWKTAIGLQDVDGLEPSEYLIKTANQNINGTSLSTKHTNSSFRITRKMQRKRSAWAFDFYQTPESVIFTDERSGREGRGFEPRRLDHDTARPREGRAVVL